MYKTNSYGIKKDQEYNREAKTKGFIKEKGYYHKKNGEKQINSRKVIFSYKKYHEDIKKKSIEEQRLDPNSPLFSEIESFERFNLNPKLLKGLHQYGFKKPSRIQSLTLPIILNSKKNLIAQSQSGTGKTACFTIAMLSAVDPSAKEVQCIVVSPTMELATQNYKILQELSKFMEGIEILQVTKGKRFMHGIKSHIVCGTPGKILSLLNRKKIDGSTVQMLCLDEADQLLEANSLRDPSIQIKEFFPQSVRVLLFSATYRDTSEKGFENEEDAEKEQKIINFAKDFVPEPVEQILVPKEKLALSNMKQYFVPCRNFEDKVSCLSDLYGELTIGQSIIFVNTKKDANELKKRMVQEGHTVSVLHASLSVEERKETLQLFQENKTKVLISSNVLSRGLDIPRVTVVVNFDIPINFNNQNEPDYTVYLHRIGRTARFGAFGTSINFVTLRDYKMIKMLEKYFSIQITPIKKEKIDQIKY